MSFRRSLTAASIAIVAGKEMTCGDLKDFYKGEACCGAPGKALSKMPGDGACPYNFAKPACEDAEAQAPRDLTAGAAGFRIPKAVALNEEQTEMIPLVNVHWHLGAEHKAAAFSDDTKSKEYDAAKAAGRRLAEGAVRPGFMCAEPTEAEKQAYEFKYCKGETYVGGTYEIHYVHSTAGYSKEDLENNPDIDGIDDGLGGAANGRGLLNPMVAVQGQVYQIVHGGMNVEDLLHGWTVVGHDDSVMYPGSTTGPSHNDEVCSPYTITWHVDKACHKVSPESFDNLCKMAKELYGLEGDLYPHGSRQIVDSRWVVPESYVKKLH